jgi:hypothetical protein
LSSITVVKLGLFHHTSRSHGGQFAQTAADLFPRNCGTDENLVVRKPICGSTRLRWVSEQSKHRRTATRQRSIFRSTLKQFPLDTAEQGVPLEDRSLEIVREGGFLRAPAESAELD